MKWYFASRVRHQSKLVDIAKFLETKDEEVVSKWIYRHSVKPYHENVPIVQEYATAVIEELLQADIFVLISDPEGTDMFVELGIALGQNHSTRGTPRIYIVGEHAKRSLMQLSPAINHTKTLDEVFTKEGINEEGSGLSITF